MKKWIEKYIPLLLAVGLAFVIIIVCLYIYWTTADTLRNHPEITEIETFAPPRLDLMLVTVSIVALVCGLALKFGKPDENH